MIEISLTKKMNFQYKISQGYKTIVIKIIRKNEQMIIEAILIHVKIKKKELNR